jgi:hypothetical protein
MAATSDNRMNNIDTKMKTVLASEKAVLGPVQRKTKKEVRKR